MTLLLAACTAVLAGCYGWEYPKLKEIRLVENSPAVARFWIDDLEGAKGESYVGKVIEVEGTIGHITNKGGRPALSLGGNSCGLFLSFGPDERQPLKALKSGDRAWFRGLLVKVPRAGHQGTLEPAVLLR